MSTRITPAESQYVNGDGRDAADVEVRLVDDLVRGVRRVIDDIDVGELLDDTRQWVRDHPVLTVAAAAGAGFLIATIYRVASSDRSAIRGGGFIRETAGGLAEAVDSRARALRDQASRDIADVLSTVTVAAPGGAGNEHAPVEPTPAQAGRAPTDTLKSVLAAIVLTKVGEWLARLR